MYKGFNITIGLPVYNNYSGLRKCIISAEKGEVVPDYYLIFDNGGIYNNILFKDEMEVSKIILHRPGYNQGVAKAWNFIIKNSNDIRIICNDDIEFHRDTIKVFVDNFDGNKITFPDEKRDNLFSCFSIPTKLFNIIGEFDESISPNYAYYEDNDYYRRTILYGQEFGFQSIPTGYEHIGSTTLKNYSPGELSLHHKKFELAKANYIKKWGGLPNEEKFTMEYNGEKQ